VIEKMFNAVQPKTPEAVLAALTQHGAAIGAKKMMTWEFKHAKEAQEKGLYVTWYNIDKEYECTRIGKFSRCFCNHLYGKHKLKTLKNGRVGKNPCTEEGCLCSNYIYMYRRPEEIGQYYMTRRKGFDINEWRPLCKCRHPHAMHSADKQKCKNCACRKFISDFMCLGCESKWEAHEVRYESEDDRKADNKTVGEAFFPLSDVPEIQAEFLKQIKEEEEKRKKEKAEEVSTEDNKKTEGKDQEVAHIGQQMAQVAENIGKVQLTLPAREKPEKSIRLMKEKGLLNKY